MTAIPAPREEPSGSPTVDLAGLQAELAALREDLTVLRDVVDDALHPGSTEWQPTAGDDPFEPRYPSLESWVGEYFAPTYARPTNPTVRWCAQ